MPARKRQAPSTPPAAAGRRRSQRIDSSGTTSKYFEADSDEDAPAPKRARRVSSGRGKKVDSESEDEYDDADEEGEEDVEAEDSDDGEGEVEQAPRGKKAGRKVSRVSKAADDSDDGDGDDDEAKVTFIPHKKLRDDGGVAYADDRVHQNTIWFLKELKANNKRSWLKGTSFLASLAEKTDH